MIRFIASSLFVGCFLATTLCGAEANTGNTQIDSVVPPTRLGLYGAVAFNFSSSEIKTWQLPIPGNPLLTRYATDSVMYTDGSTNVSFVGGGIVGIPINRTIHFTGRLGVNWISASNEVTQQVSQDSSLLHTLSSSLIYLDVTPGLEFHGLFGSTPIYLLGGLEFGIPLSTSREQLTNLYVKDEYKAQEVTTGPSEIPDAAVRAALMLGGGYNIMVSRSAWLQPELTYRLPLTEVSTHDDYSPWKIGQLRLGVNLTFDISPEQESEKQESKKASARFNRLTTYDKDSREVEVTSLNVEDVAYTEMFPIVPYVFYPENESKPSADLQTATTKNERGDFTPETLPLDAVEVNRNTLNIIGTRLKATPHATLTITGTTDGKAEAGTPDLAQMRAHWAKDYLVTQFGIEPERIAVRTTPVPEKASAKNDPDGVAENRRIEFASNVPDVLKPLTITADNQRISTPNLVMFHPVVENADSVKDWTLVITQAGRPMREIHGKGHPASITWSIKPNELSTAQVPVDYEFIAHTPDGQEATATGSVPVDYFNSVRKKTENLPDRTVDKYSLILFDFDKATLIEDNSRILEQMVLPSIKTNSTVTIIGYTDRIGTPEHNQQLSHDRANTVKTFLAERAKDAKYTSIGVGESTEVYPNAGPIGRQLSRTVQVLIETPRR